MSKEIVVNAEEDQTRIAIVEGGNLVELYIEDSDHKRTIGNIMLGRVRKVMPSIQAAFVDIGQESDAFLHFSDVSDNLPVALKFLSADPPRVSDIEVPDDARRSKRGKRRKPKGKKNKNGNSSGKSKRRGKEDAQKRKGRRSAQKRYSKRKSQRPEKILKRGQTIMVKVAKEPIANKGSRITTDLSLAGRFLVLVPLANFVAVSKKISNSKERRRLKALAKSLLPDGFGAIVRTVAEGRDAKSLDTDLKLLLERWRRIENKLKHKPRAPHLLHEDVDMVSSIIRDLFSSDYDRILIDNRRLHRSIKSYVQAVAPKMADNVVLHDSNRPVFEEASIRLGAESAFERRVDLPSGGYLFIERTEAMHVVDVNSGRAGKGMSQEQNSLRVNLEAARTIARQIRLRDLGGIIVVDFIDLRSENNRKKICDELKKEFQKDRAVTKVLPMSDFGVVQITRQRLRPSITTTFSSANGSDSNGESGEADSDELQRLRSKVSQLRQKAQQAQQSGQPTDQLRRLENKLREARKEASAYKEQVQTAKSEAQSARDEARSARKQVQQAREEAEKAIEGAIPPDELVERIEQWITRYKSTGNRRTLSLRVHPFTAAYLNRSVPSYATRWFMRHLIRVRIEPDAELSPLAFRFSDVQSGKDLTDGVLNGTESDEETKETEKTALPAAS